MGKASKGSRKGKKAWRANIGTDDIDDFFEKQTRDAHAGTAAIPSLPSDSLFFVDKPATSASTSAAGASDTTTKDIPVKRKIEKKREKVLYHESVLKRNPFVQPIPSSVPGKKDKKIKKKKLQETQGEKSVPMENDSVVKNFDIWAVDGKGDSKAKKRSTISVIPAVEVEPAGCSFNPPFEAHQDSLAQAVADEKRKEYMKELGPAPVPLIVPGEAIAEEDKFFLDAGEGDEDEDAAENDGDQDADTSIGQRKNTTKRVTRVEMNRRARRKERLRAEAKAKKMENILKEIDSLPNIMDEIAKEDKEKEKRHKRRTVVKEERRKSGPPRLGRHKFEPAPVQVLLTEEISGSLRKLKGCCNLARDRYKSIEKRGILAPSKRISKRR